MNITVQLEITFDDEILKRSKATEEQLIEGFQEIVFGAHKEKAPEGMTVKGFVKFPTKTLNINI